ncbi:MAG: HAD-IA family hydrolase [Candidatus Omnitrophica bacterium]|nr:HAD-IA family hydrolase [Candidatus Omnitrophota bacterium]
MDLRMESRRSPYIKHLFVCVNRRDAGVTCCSHGGGEAIKEKLKAFVKANGLKGKVRVSSSGCMDLCALGPNVMVEPDHRWYSRVTLEEVDRIIEEHLAPLIPGSPVPPSPVRAFLFDLGNVLVRFDHMAAARRIAAHAGMGPEELCRIFFESPLVVDHDEGRISTEEFHQSLKRQIGLRLGYEEFLSVWNDIFTPDPESQALVERLIPSYPCYLISNTNRPHFEHARRICPLLDRLHGRVLSYEVGHLKPHPAIYRRALELAKVPPPEILYVDDREDLIEAGRRLGFQAHRFEGADLLRTELERRGAISTARSERAG